MNICGLRKNHKIWEDLEGANGYSCSVLDCWSIGRASDPEPVALIRNNIQNMQNHDIKHHSFGEDLDHILDLGSEETPIE